MKKVLLVILLPILFTNSSTACSACAVNTGKQMVVGKNLDWFCDLAMVVVNKRNVKKTALLRENPMQWVSKYGSVTINPNGIGIPCGGMNEAGLVIEESWLDETSYPAADKRPAIDEIQWIQYQLDNCRSVDEVIASDKKLRIEQYYGKSHYFVYDRKGNALTVDAMNGKMVFNKIPKTGVQVLTNHNYTESLQSLGKYTGFGGTQPVKHSAESLDRFCTAADIVKKYNPAKEKDIVGYTFGILKAISQPATSWSIVYDIKNLTVNFKTARYPEVKQLKFKNFDFNCGTPVMLIDINLAKPGDISKDLVPYTQAKNKDMVLQAVQNWRKNNFASHITDAQVVKIYEYPETMQCSR